MGRRQQSRKPGVPLLPGRMGRSACVAWPAGLLVIGSALSFQDFGIMGVAIKMRRTLGRQEESVRLFYDPA